MLQNVSILLRHLRYGKISFGSIIGFRRKGFFYKNVDFKGETFEQDEVLVREAILNFFNISIFGAAMFSIREMRSIFLGRCYTVCQRVTIKENPLLYFLHFKNSGDMKGKFLEKKLTMLI